MFTVKQDVVRQAFESAGYDDVQFDEVITARRSDGGEWEVTVDHGGQMKVTRTAAEGEAVERKLALLGRTALALTEKIQTVTVLFKLNETSELGVVLKALDKAL